MSQTVPPHGFYHHGIAVKIPTAIPMVPTDPRLEKLRQEVNVLLQKVKPNIKQHVIQREINLLRSMITFLRREIQKQVKTRY